MMRQLFLGCSLLVVAGGMTARAAAGTLPTFDDFRRIDRERRLTGQLQTDELIKVTQVDPRLMVKTAQLHPDDPRIIWGAAELITDWPAKRILFETALEEDHTNVAVALHYATAAVQHSDFTVAREWLGYCELNDSDNTAPWLVEQWVLRQLHLNPKPAHEPEARTSDFRDYSVEATRARTKTLEAAGYSAYSARRLGMKADSAALSMARDLIKPPIPDVARPLLKDAARSMQEHGTFLLDEFVGQTIEGALLSLRPDASTSVTVRYRFMEMEDRRQALQDLLAQVEHGTVDFTTEAQMVQYFDNVLNEGEETAMKDLMTTVRRQTPP